jgi:HD superfamily phosphohydrolase YqeK
MNLKARDEQSLAIHLVGASTRSARLAARFEASLQDSIAGLLHDLGKAEEAFQKRVRGDNKAEKQPHAHKLLEAFRFRSRPPPKPPAKPSPNRSPTTP